MHQRRLRNLLLKPLLQIRLGLYSILLSLAFAIIFSVVMLVSFRRLFDFIMDMTDARDQVLVAINEQVNIMTGWLVLITVAYVVLVVLLSIVFTHRLIGPTIAFRRHIRALIDGNLRSRVVIRRGDAFNEVAEDLNTLAEKLQENQNKK